MAHDYAHRPQRTRTAAVPAGRFHWVSFVAGVGLGIAVTVAGAMLPGWLAKERVAVPVTAASPADVQPTKGDATTRYEFYERLPRVRVGTDTTPYGGGASTPAPADALPQESPEFVLQAGSFRNREDADRLRVSLEEVGFNAITTAVTLGGGTTRHRVLVGPFDSEPEVHRALTQLRERDIDALLMARKG